MFEIIVRLYSKKVNYHLEYYGENDKDHASRTANMDHICQKQLEVKIDFVAFHFKL